MRVRMLLRKCSPWNILFLNNTGKRFGRQVCDMKMKDGLKTVEKRSVILLRWFLRLAIFAALTGIFVVQNKANTEDARYLLVLSVILVSQGLWGAVLLDCLSRRFQKKE